MACPFKLTASETALKVSENATCIFGVAGVLREDRVARFDRHALVYVIVRSFHFHP